MIRNLIRGASPRREAIAVAILPERSDGGGARDRVGLPSPPEDLPALGPLGGRADWLGNEGLTTRGATFAAGGDCANEKRQPRKPLLDNELGGGAFADGPASDSVGGTLFVAIESLLLRTSSSVFVVAS